MWTICYYPGIPMKANIIRYGANNLAAACDFYATCLCGGNHKRVHINVRKKHSFLILFWYMRPRTGPCGLGSAHTPRHTAEAPFLPAPFSPPPPPRPLPEIPEIGLIGLPAPRPLPPHPSVHNAISKPLVGQRVGARNYF